MEPVTHVLTGICLARTGLNRRAAYTTLAMAVAAEFPDIDTLWSVRGPVVSFAHHRGITHTFVGIPVEAAVIVAVVYALHRWRSRRAVDRPSRPLTAAPVRWAWLYGCTLLALLSHLFLDFTNNYGLRPFFPFNPRWYAASITFIFDPLMFALLLGALIVPPIFRLVNAEVGARRQPFVARGWAVVALLGIVGLWSFRAVEHNRAVNLAMAQSLAIPAGDASGTSDAVIPPQIYLQPQRALANPDPFNPFRWWTAIDFGPVYQLGKADTHFGTLVPAQETEPKPPPSPELQAAEASPLGRVYLDWSPMPFLSVTRPMQQGTHDGLSGDEIPPGHTLVTFRDPRFMGDIPAMRSRTPLEGTVELDAQNRVVRETMGGSTQPE